jgi:chemotaxis response regulator CheB
MSQSKSVFRIIIADYDEIFRERLCGLLEKEPDLKVVAIAGSSDETMQLTDKLKPELLLLLLRGLGSHWEHFTDQERQQAADAILFLRQLPTIAKNRLAAKGMILS